MRYLFWGILFAVFAGFISRHSTNYIFGFISGLFLAEILSLRNRISILENTSKLHTLSSFPYKAKPETQYSKKFAETEAEINAGAEAEINAATEAEINAETEAEIKITEKEQINNKDYIDYESSNTKIIIKLIDYIKNFFTTGNVVLKLGIIIIFFGVSFLLKYAAQRNLFPIEFRLISVVIAAICMIITGWIMRNRYAESSHYENDMAAEKNNNKLQYGVMLQGGGVGILYLTVFAGSKLYHLLPNTFSLVLMIMLVAFSCALSVMQDAKSLAVSGIIGGFIAPVLMSTGQGSHVMLFSYYALLNSGILGIAWFKAWRELNLAGFLFTFIISSVWGSRYYNPSFFSTTEPFLILFFLFYVLISILFAHRQPPKLKGFIDGPIVFGVPLVCFGLQSSLVRNIDYGLSITAITTAFFYIFLAAILWNKFVQGMRMLTEAFLAIGVVFGTLAIPLALDGRWTSTAWALEGAAMVWVGIRQNRLLARLFGILLQIGSGLAFISSEQNYYHFMNYNASSYHSYSSYIGFPFINQFFLGSIFISIAGLFSSYYMMISRDREDESNQYAESSKSSRMAGPSKILRKWERCLHIPLLFWGLIWWFGGGLNEVDHQFLSQNKYNIFLIYAAVSSYLFSIIAKKLKWHHLLASMIGFLPVMVLILGLALLDLFGTSHLFARWGSFAWITAFIVQYALLWHFDSILIIADKAVEQYKQYIKELQKNNNSNYDKGFIYSIFFKIKTFIIYLITKSILWSHLMTMWTLIFIVSHETVWSVQKLFDLTKHSFFIFDALFEYPSDNLENSYTWARIFWGIVPASFVLILIQKGEKILKWPVGKYKDYYLEKGVTLPAFLLVLWILFTNFYSGNPKPLPYIVFMNPLELSQIFVLITLFIWTFQLKNIFSLKAQIILFSLIFIWLNFVTGRVVHFYFDIPFDFYNLTGSIIFQAAISILWGTTALFSTKWAAKKGKRKVWFAGAALLGMLVLKLFTVDLSGIKTVARIVSFLAVGGLMLLIGYISPLPPNQEIKKAKIKGNE